VVAVGAGDPVATGLINSLAHPGGNITGISDNAATLSTKRLGLLKQAVPNVRKVAMLWNKSDLGMTLRYQASADAAKALDVSVQPLGVGEPDDFEDAFAAMDGNPPDAILMVSDPLMMAGRRRPAAGIICRRSCRRARARQPRSACERGRGRGAWRIALYHPPMTSPVALFPAGSEREKISFNQINKTTGNRIRLTG
jgi:ABC transporter substrate binding protein